jgi:hypothetical protein
MPLSDLQKTVCAALEQGRAMSAQVPHLNINGTSNQLEAELVDLVECLAAATGRTCRWYGGSLMAQNQQPPSPRFGSRAVSEGLTYMVHRSSSSSKLVANNVTILHEPAAAAHAARLQQGMERTLGRRCETSLPTEVEEMVRGLEKIVAHSRCVLLLQTRDVLSQPWALLAAYRASLASIPITCVVVDGGGYDFDGAKQHLELLSERLDVVSLEQLSAVLSLLSLPSTSSRPSGFFASRRSRSYDMTALQTQLASLIPQIISVVYNPEGSYNELTATVRDIRDKQRLLTRRTSRRTTDESALTNASLSSFRPKKTPGRSPSSQRGATATESGIQGRRLQAEIACASAELGEDGGVGASAAGTSSWAAEPGASCQQDAIDTSGEQDTISSQGHIDARPADSGVGCGDNEGDADDLAMWI